MSYRIKCAHGFVVACFHVVILWVSSNGVIHLTISLQWRQNGHDSVSNHSLTVVYSTVIQAQIKENIKAPRHWPLCGEFTCHRWIPRTKGQLREKYFHLMTSSWRGYIKILVMACNTINHILRSCFDGTGTSRAGLDTVKLILRYMSKIVLQIRTKLEAWVSCMFVGIYFMIRKLLYHW